MPFLRLLEVLVTPRVFIRGLCVTLRVALGIAASILLVALLYAPFTDRGSFAGPSPLDGCPDSYSGAFTGMTPGELVLSFASGAALPLIALGVTLFVGSAVIRDLEPALNDKPARDAYRVSSLIVATGWFLALCAGLSPC